MWYEMTRTKQMGRDVLVRDAFGATRPGTRMVPCWLVWRMYKPKSKTKPIQYTSCLPQQARQIASELKLLFIQTEMHWAGTVTALKISLIFQLTSKNTSGCKQCFNLATVMSLLF